MSGRLIFTYVGLFLAFSEKNVRNYGDSRGRGGSGCHSLIWNDFCFMR